MGGSPLRRRNRGELVEKRTRLPSDVGLERNASSMEGISRWVSGTDGSVVDFEWAKNWSELNVDLDCAGGIGKGNDWVDDWIVENPGLEGVTLMGDGRWTSAGGTVDGS